VNIRCLVVDDEELARNLLASFIGRLPYLELVRSCKNPMEAMTVLQEQKIDLMFLDIQMPELTGIEFLKTLPHKPVVIFTTAYPQYALEGYQLDVMDYLLKPFGFDRFLQAVNKASELLSLKAQAEVKDQNQVQADSGLAQGAFPPPKEFLVVKSEHKLIRLRFADIHYIQGKGEYVSFHTPKGQVLSLMSLKKLDDDLPDNQFVRIHKSYIVPLTRIDAVEGNMVHLGPERLPIGASYKEELLRRFR
jgi:DNA-binding LytR/AlgR family response regulator